ncbi:MAG: glycosyltransferase [Oscillospiraceae bacterium]|nr:glycosyltransferase [Oscillospiraceae bacterium]
MKVLQINCVYKRGSTGKIVDDIHSLLKENGIESVVCYGRGKRVQEAGVYRTCNDFLGKCNHLWSRITGLMYGGCCISTSRLIRRVKRERPDVVHLHCINGYFVNVYRLVGWLKANRISTVLTLHSEFMFTANCGHAFECNKWMTGCGKCPQLYSATESYFFDRTHASWRRMQQAFAGFEKLIVTSVSPWLMQRAQQAPILQSFEQRTVLNGVDTAVFRPVDVSAIAKEYKTDGRRVFLHVNADFRSGKDHPKGGWYLLELAKQLPDVLFLVAGPHEKGMKLPPNVRLLGYIENQERMAQLYSLADATVLTSSRETFSMPVAESLCCGTPVVGFCAGAPEMISIPEYSNFVPFGDLPALADACSRMGRKNAAQIAAAAAGKFDRKEMSEEYLRIYELLEKEKE